MPNRWLTSARTFLTFRVALPDWRGLPDWLGLPFGAPGGEQLVLQPEHGGVLIGIGVVVAEQVQDSVHAQQLKLVLSRMAGLTCLRRGDLRAEHDVAE